MRLPEDELFANAVRQHQRGDTAGAELLYRAVLACVPEHPAALNNLALLSANEAVGLLRRAVAAEPRYVDAWVNLSNALHGRDDAPGAAQALERAVALMPPQPDALIRLAQVLLEAGRDAAAAEQYGRALHLEPNCPSALSNLGVIHFRAERMAEAEECYRRALAIDPAFEPALLNLTGVLEAAGRLREAAELRARLPRPRPLQMQPAPTPRRTVLILAHASAGNTPLDTVIRPDVNNRLHCLADCATAEQLDRLPPFDVAFNAVANADLMDISAPLICQLAERHTVLNHPGRVAPTRRDRLSALLAGIPGVAVPETRRVLRQDLQNSVPLAPPLIIRPIGGHGGEGAIRLDDADAVARFTPGGADAYYVTRFHDTRGADGLYRKYRVIYVDREPYPYHLAISPHWLVHYFSADMQAHCDKRAEEARFLDDPLGALGPEAMASVTAIGRRMDLDYAGVDFTLLPDGRLLVFEANPAMLIHLRDDSALFPAKHRAVPRIFTAIEAMLARHTALAAAAAMTPCFTREKRTGT